MKNRFAFWSALILSAASASAFVLPFDFTAAAVEPDSSYTYSFNGDVWRAQNISVDYSIDAIFTITGTEGAPQNAVTFVNASTNTTQNNLRGNNMRVLMGQPDITNALVFISVQFVVAGTNTPFTGWAMGDKMVTQFSDLDSDAGADRTDLGGVRTAAVSQSFTSDYLDPGSSLLEIIEGPTFAPDYTVGLLQVPWGPQGNVISTDPVDQAPVTAAFLMNATSSFQLVVGQRANGNFPAYRHIDIDMTPDFNIIPEPSTYAMLLGSLALLAIGCRRFRR